MSAHGSVTLLEAEPVLAYHASGRSAALYEPHYGLKPVVDLSMDSGDFLRTLPGVLAPRGMMIIAKTGEGAAMAAEAATFALDPISVDEARAIVPVLNGQVAHAALGHHAWDIDTDLLLQGFARTARANGATIQTGAKVTAISRDAGDWLVVTPMGAFRAKTLVNAAGAWVDEIARMAGIMPLGFTACRRSMARIAAPGGHDVSGWPLLFGLGESWYAKPDAGALIVSPAEEHPMDPHDAFADDMVLAEGLARYQEMVTEPVTRLLASWAGLRTFAPDRVLVIGPDPVRPAFFWLAGQGGYGFQTCPAASQLAADLLAGRSPAMGVETLTALSPLRFR